RAVDRQLAGHEGHGRAHLAVEDGLEHLGAGGQRAIRRLVARPHARAVQHDRPLALDDEFRNTVESALHLLRQLLHSLIDYRAHPHASLSSPYRLWRSPAVRLPFPYESQLRVTQSYHCGTSAVVSRLRPRTG